jgi:hypothetical protein
MTTGIYHGIRTKPSTPEYRENYERIFGDKQREKPSTKETNENKNRVK